MQNLTSVEIIFFFYSLIRQNPHISVILHIEPCLQSQRWKGPFLCVGYIRPRKCVFSQYLLHFWVFPKMKFGIILQIILSNFSTEQCIADFLQSTWKQEIGYFKDFLMWEKKVKFVVFVQNLKKVKILQNPRIKPHR